ncbi:uncharacterized protein MELLADRAFT_90473 [Melampsora larici-populina 98AG31]|uniref:Uncharacterized protein n=1 Tax=Melampsora larici-populina (strain 98AG31 / pathotype 3-4-7) TaxID=747676 RepID=F4SEF4_MELLP|nr:uncharacterized protein MELLADRAFT_90473 [Melampsora larici-populina 98AG31]EGF96972.1 hypothetical protein MELLADRAFT_90473 [Melampsora larici-populina 98AG31]
MSSPFTSNGIDTSSDVLTPTTPLHISTLPVSSAAARSILEVVMSTRGSAERDPVSIPLTAHPGVKEGKDQCMKCGMIGHRTYQCAEYSTSAESIPDWRRTTNGKIYSVKALLGMHPYCKWTMDTVLEDSSSRNLDDNSPSATPTPVPTSVASKASNDESTNLTSNDNSTNLPANEDTTNLNIEAMYFEIGRSVTSAWTEGIDISPPSPTPPATLSSPSAVVNPRQDSRSKGKGSLHQAFNPLVTPWNDWYEIWNRIPKHQQCCCCRGHKQTCHRSEPYSRNRRAGSCPMEES